MKSAKTLFHFVPFFPKQKFLEKHWWHRLAKVVVAISSFFLFSGVLLGIYSFVILLLTFILPRDSVVYIDKPDLSSGKYVEKKELISKIRTLHPYFFDIDDEKILEYSFSFLEIRARQISPFNSKEEEEAVKALSDEKTYYKFKESKFNNPVLKERLENTDFFSLFVLLVSIGIFPVVVYRILLYIFIGDLNKKEKL